MSGTVEFIAVFLPLTAGLVLGGAVVATVVARKNQARRIKAHFRAKKVGDSSES